MSATVALVFGKRDFISTYKGVKVNWRQQVVRDLESEPLVMQVNICPTGVFWFKGS